MGALHKVQIALFKILKIFALCIGNSAPRLPAFNELRIALLRAAGMRIAHRVVIWGPLTAVPLDGLKNISIGKGTFLNTEVRFGCPQAQILIGEDVQIGPRVCFETVNHGPTIDGGPRGAFSAPITVSDRVWIGCGAIILPGVTISEGATVAAGAVVTRNVSRGCTVGGVPARLLNAQPAHTDRQSQ